MSQNVLSVWASDLQGLAALIVQLDFEFCQMQFFGFGLAPTDGGLHQFHFLFLECLCWLLLAA